MKVVGDFEYVRLEGGPGHGLLMSTAPGRVALRMTASTIAGVRTVAKYVRTGRVAPCGRAVFEYRA